MNVLSLFKPIKAFVFDVDGVLTDGSIYLMPGGEMVRSMNTRDGYALQLAVKKGYKIAIISGGKSEQVVERLNKLGIFEVHMQVHNKSAVLETLMKNYNLQKEEVLFMGDDMPDLEVMQMSGLACSPADGCDEAKEISHYISPYNGGRGCVRDVIEKVLKLNNHWLHTADLQSR